MLAITTAQFALHSVNHLVDIEKSHPAWNGYFDFFSLAGATLSAFAGALTTMYLRTPAMHKPQSVWPTPAGIAVSKDVWMLGIGLGLLADREDERDR